ncbi:DUF6255 family natural product biosynthesis protein [Streptomyces mashuensis]|uniref:DUF6255 family natural product biosynthesis protein n=1 Tax=Streptomyces mashuensis TaxID=33904 RepID=UPI00167D8F48|nr:DUF6255 family natural product biosynthesis protein [Streptomyces mashuensis]
MPPGGRVRCAHPRPAWAVTGDGVGVCRRCGTRRVADYRALAFALDLPGRTQPGGPTGRAVGAGPGHAGWPRRVREVDRRRSGA